MDHIQINAKKKLNPISPVLYGIFFEDINYSGDGGLYGELIANRSFEYYDREGKADKHKMCWEAIGDAAFEIKSENTLNQVHTHYAWVSGTKGAGVKNTGYCQEGFAVKDGEWFDFSCYIAVDVPVKIAVKIVDPQSNVYAQTEICAQPGGWINYAKKLSICGECKNAFLEVLLEEDGGFYLEFVSLFPQDTFCGRKNGLRRDMAEMLKALSPRFMRFPGGCIVEGRDFDNMYCWKDTIGPVEERKTNWNRWQMEEYQQEGRSSEDYFQSYGLGYYEYFLLCEDLEAKPVPVMNVGMTCQWHEGLLVELDQLDSWIQDVLDLIEFANGDETSKWGSKRIEMGHKEPFGLEYIGIGNEQWGHEYFERYEVFQRVIAEKYPDIKLVTSAGWTAEGKEFDLAVDWMKRNKGKAYAVDEHFYKPGEWFLENINRYDTYDRSLPKVFAGEYAAHSAVEVGARRNNWWSALCEAAFLTGVEKNADHVAMACYAPLFGRTGHQQWQPNLIWFDKDSVYGTPSYYVQKLFSNHIGELAVEVHSSDSSLKVSASITPDEKRAVVKVVNTGRQEKEVQFDLDKEVDACQISMLYGQPEDENTHADPCKIYPHTEMTHFPGTFNIKGYSVTVFDMIIKE